MKRRWASLIVLVSAVCCLSGCRSSGFHYTSEINAFLSADFNQDGKPERIYLEAGKDSSKKQLVVEQDGVVFLRVPYFDHFKEPYFNTTLAVVFEEDGHWLTKPRLLVKGGREREISLFEFQGDRMQKVPLSDSESKAFR